MSGTVTTTTPADPGSPATQSTAAAASGVSGAAVVILVWALSLVRVTVPAEVAASIMVCLAPIIHMIALKMGAGEATVAVPPGSVTTTTTPVGPTIPLAPNAAWPSTTIPTAPTPPVVNTGTVAP